MEELDGSIHSGFAVPIEFRNGATGVWGGYPAFSRFD